MGGLYEVDKNSGGTVTKTTVYYPLAGAMRVNGTLYYVLKDHLGSASVVTDNSGNVVGDQRYYPFGFTRLATGSMYTDKLFTGQREMAGLGIYHFGARFYSPYINRFLSADTVVPNPSDPQAFNRYTYAYNNPLRYVDPSGHFTCSRDRSSDDYCPGRFPTVTTPSLPQPCTRNCNLPEEEGGKDNQPSPGEILDLLRFYNSGTLAGPTNAMVEAVNSYMEKNPSNDPRTDPLLIGINLRIFSDIRTDYWRARARDTGICNGCISEGANLFTYYDMRQKIMMTGWDASNVNWRNVGFDSVATILSFVALNEVAQALKISSGAQDVAAVGAAINGVRSGAESFANNDAPGLALSLAGFIPGLPGGMASAGSVLRDLSEGSYSYEWIPPIPR